MTDHANELRRYSRKIGHPAGDVPSVMLAAAEEIERLQAKIEAAEKEVAHIKEVEFPRKARAVAAGWETKCARLEQERDALRAKVAEMEQQEPVGTLHDDGCFVWRETAPHQSNYAGWKMALYALPGAQNIPEKLCYDSRWEISIYYVDGWNAAVDMMRGKSPSWHCPDCCIAFPFGAPKSCPNDDARCNSLLAAAPEAKP